MINLLRIIPALQGDHGTASVPLKHAPETPLSGLWGILSIRYTHQTLCAAGCVWVWDDLQRKGKVVLTCGYVKLVQYFVVIFVFGPSSGTETCRGLLVAQE
jgi:hypothetical protein